MLEEYSTSTMLHTPSKIPRVLSSTDRLSSWRKTAVVTVLSWLLAWRPRLAMLLGRLIWRLLPWLTEA